VDTWQRDASQGGCGCNAARGFEELATCRKGIGRFVHNVITFQSPSAFLSMPQIDDINRLGNAPLMPLVAQKLA
jgi:hypothetical protein